MRSLKFLCTSLSLLAFLLLAWTAQAPLAAPKAPPAQPAPTAKAEQKPAPLIDLNADRRGAQRHGAPQLPGQPASLAQSASAHPGMPRANPFLQNMVPSTLKEENLNLAPYLFILPDSEGRLDIAKAAMVDRPKPQLQTPVQGQPGKQAQPAPTLEDLGKDTGQLTFKPYLQQKSQMGLAGATSGPVWFRFILQELPEGAQPKTYLLDLGDAIHDRAVLYTPLPSADGTAEWKESLPGKRGVMLLPEAGSTPLVCYLRTDSMPSVWFAPMMRTPQDAATSFEGYYRPGAMLILAVVLVICLLRALSEQGQWRVWAFLYLVCALAQAWLGVRTVNGPMDWQTVCALVAPGLALFFYPMAARTLMRCAENSRLFDWQYLLLSLPGLALVLLPLVPNMHWVSRYAEYWPLGLALFIPTTLAACLCGLAGSFRLLLGSIIPPAAVCAGIVGMKSGYPPQFLAALPLWGTALGALVVMGLPQPSPLESAGRRGRDAMPNLDQAPRRQATVSKDEFLSLDSQAAMTAQTGQAAGSLDLNLEGAIPPAPTAPAAAQPFQSAQATSAPEAPAELSLDPKDDPKAHYAPYLEAPVKDIMESASALASENLPSSSKERVNDILSSAGAIAGIVKDGKASAAKACDRTRQDFELQKLLQQAHDAAAEICARNGVGLSWYMSPTLGQHFTGYGRELERVLQSLLKTTASAMQKGCLRCSAKHMQGSSDAGELLFSIAASGKGAGIPDPLSLMQARELAIAAGGCLGMECRQDETSVTFTMGLDSAQDQPAQTGQAAGPAEPMPSAQAVQPAPSQPDPAAQSQAPQARPAPGQQPVQQASPHPAPHASQPPAREPAQAPEARPSGQAKSHGLKTILLADNPNIAVQIENILSRLGCQARTARAASDLYNLHETSPADMLILQGRSADPKLAGTLNAVKNACRLRGLPLPTILAVTQDESTWHELAKAGFTHALTLPLDEEALAGTVCEALQALGRKLPPAAPSPAEPEEAVPDLFGEAPAPGQPPKASLEQDNGSLSLDLDFGQPVKKKL